VFKKSPSTPTLELHTLGDDLEAHHPVVVLLPFLQLLSVEVQDEGQVVVQVELWGRRDTRHTVVYEHVCVCVCVGGGGFALVKNNNRRNDCPK